MKVGFTWRLIYIEHQTLTGVVFLAPPPDIRDLLSKDPTTTLELKENVDSGVYVKDLHYVVVRSSADVDTQLQAGKKNRVTGATLMNAQSSRSHSIFTVTVETSEVGADGKPHIRVGKLNLVDLAGG